ncbi:hypothetical protein NLU13_6053 [Sarocladium strictum]|uniref:Uncharacterized protein n=1 Tax=Sarocladium strictum TaxID=5046 RepID=A0AA39GFS7_SARSR|nr:hypothetical protein NLU13_6053 [Sarocladium strictum]
MPSHRVTRKRPKEPLPRRATRQSTQSARLPSALPSVALKADPPAMSNPMNVDYPGHHGHSQLGQQPPYGGGGRHAISQGLQTPHHHNSFGGFDSAPVDLTGATMLSQNEYHSLTNTLPQPHMSSFRQSQSSGAGHPNSSFNLSTPQHNPFTSSIGPHTPSHQTVSPEVHPQAPPIPRPPFPGFMPRQLAADVLRNIRSQNFRLDSTVCKKLASEPALREPEQRNPDRVLNMGRRGNAEALLCQITGQEAANSCKNCKRGHGPWNKCVVYAGLFYGSCSNCWFNASGARCTFQESNHHPLHQIYASMAPSYNNPFGPSPNGPSYGSGGPGSSSYPYGAPRSREGVPLTNLHFNRALGPGHGEDGGPVPTSSHPADIEVVHPDAVREITESMILDSVTWGPRARFLVRIQAAASELGMRLGEYEEFLARNNLAPDPYLASARQSVRQNDEDEDDEECQQEHDEGSQSPQPMSSIEKRDADMSGSDSAEERRAAQGSLRELEAEALP